MDYATFRSLYIRLYEKAYDSTPFNIGIRRAYRRLGSLPAAELTITLEAELS